MNQEQTLHSINGLPNARAVDFCCAFPRILNAEVVNQGMISKLVLSLSFFEILIEVNEAKGSYKRLTSSILQYFFDIRTCPAL